MWEWWKGRFSRSARLGQGDTAWFLAVAVLVGAAVGVGTALLVFTLEGLGALLDRLDDLVSYGRALPFVIVPVGLLIAWGLARRFAPEAEGDGVPEVAAALAVHAGYMPTRSIPIKILATTSTLAAGGSAGREGPIVQIGGAIGSSISRRFGLGEDQVRSLVAAGAAAGIGASFNAPIAGMLFALEVILGTFSVRHMSAVVISSVTAAVTSRSLVGEELTLRAPVYQLGDARELFLYAALGLVIVVVAYTFLRLLDRAERLQQLVPGWLRPVSFGLLVAFVGFLEPRLLGTGQDVVAGLLTLTGPAQELWWVLFALAGGKVLATAFTVPAGGSGGAFMPTLFIGAAVGAGFARLLEPVWTISDLPAGGFAVVGMAAAFAAVARAPLTAILIVFEITGARDYGLVLPLMLTATLATFIIDRLHPESVYTMPLAKRGIRLTRRGEVDILDTVRVGRAMSSTPVEVFPHMSLKEVQALLEEHRHHGLPVCNRQGQLVGIITVTDILRAGGPSDGVSVGAVMTSRPVTVHPAMPVSAALERMAALGVGRLPVVAEDDPTELLGVFRREDAVNAYHQALGETTDMQLEGARLRQRTDPGASYYVFQVPPGSVADGRPVGEVAWPEGSTLVSVRRGREVLVPAGPTVLVAGDVVTAFGTPASKETVIERLNAGADEPTAEIVVVPDVGSGDELGDVGSGDEEGNLELGG